MRYLVLVLFVAMTLTMGCCTQEPTPVHTPTYSECYMCGDGYQEFAYSDGCCSRACYEQSIDPDFHPDWRASR